MAELITTIPALPPRPETGHKGLFGRVVILGGSDSMIGAPALCGAAALRMGAGLVYIAVPRALLGAALSITAELVGLALGGPAGDRALITAARAADALVIGPGLGTARPAVARVKRLACFDKPAVIDADALNILSHERKWPAWFKAKAVLTPHPGEMSRLGRLIGRTDVPADDEGRLRLAREAALAFGQVVVLKGHRTVVTDGRRAYVNQTGDSTLSKAGTGDVLSGMIGCLLGQRMPAFDAAILATYLHGRAGEIAGRKLGRRCALARDVIDAIGQAIGEHEQG